MGINKTPPELARLDQWVICKGKSKKPYNALTLEPASVSDPSTWSSYEDAIAAVKSGKASGMGFVFTIDDGLCGIDLDGVIDDSGNMTSEAQEIVSKLDSYTEVSRGKHGAHVIVRAKKPTLRCRKKWIEIYETGRYFIITGKIWRDRKVINDNQDALEWLCGDTFGELIQRETEPAAVSGLVLDPNAEPPVDKLDALMKDRDFKRTWNHRREDFPSLSEYDLSLAGFAMRGGWSEQETADLMIAFRRRWGEPDKVLRPDYIPGRIAKARSSAEKDLLGLLPFTVIRMRQIGVDDPDYVLDLDEGESIDMGKTDELRTVRKVANKLYDHGYELPGIVVKDHLWPKIAMKLRELVEITETVTREDTTKEWLEDYIRTRHYSLPKIGEDGDMNDMFGCGRNSMAADTKGRVYVRISDLTRYARAHSGIQGMGVKAVAHDLIDLGFTKRKIYVKEEGRRKQIALWVSKPGFIMRGDA